MLRTSFVLAGLLILSICPMQAIASRELTADGTKFLLDGEEFDLWGVRVQSALYSDLTTEKLIRWLPTYRDFGVTAVCVFAMGGDMDQNNESYPDAFNYDGTIDPNSVIWRRLDSLLRECDRLGMVVNLGLFHGHRDEMLGSDAVALQAVSSAFKWLSENGHRNVLVDVANEHGRAHFDVPILRDKKRLDELLLAAKEAAWDGALYGSSSLGEVYSGENATVIFIHGSQKVPPKSTRPAVCNDPGMVVRDWRNGSDPGIWRRTDKGDLVNHITKTRKQGAYWFFTSGWKQFWPMHFETGPDEGEPSDYFAFAAIKAQSKARPPAPQDEDGTAAEDTSDTPPVPEVKVPSLAEAKPALLAFDGKFPSLAIGDDRTVHLAYSRQGRAYYAALRQDKQAGAPAWTVEESVGIPASFDSQAAPRIAVDSLERVHLVSGAGYAFRDPAADGWTKVRALLGEQQDVAVDINNTVWFAFVESPLGVTSCGAGDTDMGERETLFSGARKKIYPDLASDHNGLHMVCRVRGLPGNRGYDVAYVFHDGRQWQQAQWPDHHDGASINNWPRVALTPGGDPVVLWTDEQVKLSIRDADGAWPEEPLTFGKAVADDVPCLSVDGDGNIFIVQKGGLCYYRMEGEWFKDFVLPRPETVASDATTPGLVTCASLGGQTYFAWEYGDRIAFMVLDLDALAARKKALADAKRAREEESGKATEAVRKNPDDRTEEEIQKELERIERATE